MIRLGHEVRDTRDGSVGVFQRWAKLRGTSRAMVRYGKVLRYVPPHCLEKVMDPETIKGKKRRSRANA